MGKLYQLHELNGQVAVDTITISLRWTCTCQLQLSFKEGNCCHGVPGLSIISTVCLQGGKILDECDMKERNLSYHGVYMSYNWMYICCYFVIKYYYTTPMTFFVFGKI